MDIAKVDLNLLVVLDALLEQRGVTRAAEQLGLSQPATSAALARLRRLLGDPLFVKAGQEMRPTPRAIELAAPVRRVLGMVREEILQTAGFDPATSDKTFQLIAPDIAEVILLPRLLARLRERAPGVRIRAQSMPRHAAAQALASGAADLALGYFPDLRRNEFYQQRLFKHRYRCVVRRDHPGFGARMTLRQYLDAPHAVVWPEGREHLFETYMQSRKLERRVVLELSHFTSLLTLIPSSDLIATVPEDLASFFEAHADIRVLDLPLRAPEVEVHQFWHQRLHRDAAHAWLRQQMHEALGH
jgi:DNA-binding transcriptional LysR family regulator